MIKSLDHLVITITDPEATSRFYVDGLGMAWTTFWEGREALAFGIQKINIHHQGREFEPKARHPTSGSADLCFLTDTRLDDVADRMKAQGFPILEGPVPRTGAIGPITSLYFRDPDGNLIEVANAG